MSILSDIDIPCVHKYLVSISIKLLSMKDLDRWHWWNISTLGISTANLQDELPHNFATLSENLPEKASCLRKYPPKNVAPRPGEAADLNLIGTSAANWQVEFDAGRSIPIAGS